MMKRTWYLVLACIALPPASLAQELEEIVVTAQRREENLQEVPVSITAFSSQQIVRQNLNEAKDYLQLTPNVNFTEDGEVGQRSVGISIRGVSDFADTFTGVGGLSNSFGIYLDEFNIANSATKTANPQLVDLERLEVLRGPQGTYFGRNATGGALNLTTKLPSAEDYYEFGVGFARFNTWTGHGIVNTPVTDNFFVRGVLWYEQSDGFLKNTAPTGRGNDYEHFNGRVALRWEVNDQFTADFSVMRTVENDGSDSNVPSGVSDFDTPNSTPNILQVDPFGALDVFDLYSNIFPVDPGAGFFPANDRTISKDFAESNENESTIVNLRLNYQGDNWSIRSITGILESESHRRFDQDLTQYSLYETYSGRTGDTISQEFRFNYQSDRWDFTAGVLYADDTADTYGISPIGRLGFFFIDTADLNPDGTLAPNFTCFFCLNPGDIIAGPGVDTFDAESLAVFAEANFNITDALKVTLGVRYTEDDIEVNVADLVRVPFHQQPFNLISSFQQPGPNDPSVAAFDSGSGSFDAITPRLVVSWSPTDELNTYASASNGYKPGGITFQDTGSGPVGVPFDEESLWSYEIGAKWRGLDDRLQINASAFFMDWDDLQIPSVEILIVNNNVVNNFRIINSKAEATGFELEVQGLLTDNLLVGGSLGLLDTEFKSFAGTSSDTSNPDVAPFIINNMGFALDGVTLPRAPETTLYLFAQYDFEVSGLPAWVRLDWSWRDEITSDIEAVVSQLPILDNAATQALGLDTEFNGNALGNGVPFPWPRGAFPTLVPDYDVANLRAGIEGERWAVTAYIENLFDENYYTGTQENFGLAGFRLRPHFMVAGINFRFFSN
ncbi:MAG: TonB-dependent receptor [Woeseiaceae bacterium]|nr:TonB-dependent receptor [Woeseiaceae bacterium]